ncbi:MAG: MIP family channel protein [Verrucomicrobia bacterium]|nr:MIP family channel protein [Verrucomicrobiota bacterium]
MRSPLLPAWFAGELLGTFLLVLFGCGSVATAVLLGAQVGVFQVAIVWGLGVCLAIQVSGGWSGAHLNPAVTLAMAQWSDFPWRRVPGYVAAQMLGAFLAAAVLFWLFQGALSAHEAKLGLLRGGPGSEASAMIFAEFFPNPGGRPLTPAALALIAAPQAFVAEVLGTAVLLLVICAVTDPANSSRASGHVALSIGLTVTALISILGPLTMACLNPARDLAPRLFTALAGWGWQPFLVNGWGWLTVYVLAPLLGAQLGAGIYRALRPVPAK